MDRINQVNQSKPHTQAQEKANPKLPERLLIWYGKNARILPWRKDKDPYHVWLSEIMLQQTRVDTVKDYYTRFLNELPSVAALAKAEEEKVLKLWEGLGYYSRARNLHKTAKIITDNFGGKFPEDHKSLLSLPGIGDYTAGAIASICFEQPHPAVDGNVLRIISRITENFHCIDDPATKKEISNYLALVYPEGHCGDFTQSLMELGAMVCLPNSAPLCGRCPVNDICMANQNDSARLLPVRKEKNARKMQDITMLILRHDNKVALRKRPEKGVLSGLWEFPNVEEQLDTAQVSALLQSWENGNYSIGNIVHGKHIFTHIQWNVICYFIDCRQTFGTFEWVDSELMEDEIALPTAFKKFWDGHAHEIHLSSLSGK